MLEKKKRKVVRNLGRENGNFFTKNRHSEILVREKCFRLPLTRRQVSATVNFCNNLLSSVHTMLVIIMLYVRLNIKTKILFN